MVDDPTTAAFRSSLERQVPSYNLPEWDRITGEMQLVAERMVRGLVSIDAAAAEMDVRADAILAKRRWLLDRGRLA